MKTVCVITAGLAAYYVSKTVCEVVMDNLQVTETEKREKVATLVGLTALFVTMHRVASSFVEGSLQ